MGLPTKLLLLFGGMFLGAVGILIAGMGLLGIVDPVGTKMSDDADTFGSITAFDHVQSVVTIGIGLLTLAGGVYLVWSIDKKK